jgi:hypothetical protein
MKAGIEPVTARQTPPKGDGGRNPERGKYRLEMNGEFPVLLRFARACTRAWFQPGERFAVLQV